MISMVKVTRIAVQKKNKGRYNIFIEKDGKEEYGFSLEEETLINEGLYKNQEVAHETIDRLMRVDDLNKAYSRALNYLSYRMRSTKELSQYLSDKEIDQEQINEIIVRLKKQKLLDDQAFADAFVRTKMNTSSNGPERIRTDLFKKGIKGEIVDRALLHFSEDIQKERIEQWVNKQTKKTTRNSHRQSVQKIEQQLVRKGFDLSVIKQTTQEMSLEKDEQEEWQALIYQGERALKRYQTKSEGFELQQKIKASLYQKGFNQDDIERFINDYFQE